MAIYRAVVSGQILNAVQVRNMFVCDVTEVGGDTYPILFDAYIHGIYDAFQDLVSPAVSFSSYEIQRRNAGHWEPAGIFSMSFTPGGSGVSTPNQMALTLVAKALGIRKTGRKFFSGLDTSGMSGNTLTVGGLVVAATMLAAYVTPFTGIGGGTITPGIYDKDGNFQPFVGGLVSSFLGTMRRRKPGVGI